MYHHHQLKPTFTNLLFAKTPHDPPPPFFNLFPVPPQQEILVFFLVKRRSNDLWAPPSHVDSPGAWTGEAASLRPSSTTGGLRCGSPTTLRHLETPKGRIGGGEVFFCFFSGRARHHIIYYIRKQNTKTNGLGLSESSWIEGKWLEWTCMKLKSPAEFVKS